MTILTRVTGSNAKLRSLPTPASRWVAALLAVTIWVLGLLAVSPQLHAALHSDADHQDHVCAITLFSHGVDVASHGAAQVSAPILFASGDNPLPAALPVTGDHYRLPPGCGPPAC
ncbi:MAG: hypothetical protein JWQ62_1300 [Lacunisphaera sp.]|jgi:hypothetical protein|nr:hypothetical protein [Lacunisphaera sp.]